MDKDPITGKPYPPDAIQRILYVTQKVHIYPIPPITSSKGFNAATWTQNPKDLLFTCRLRILETALPPPASSPETPERVSTTILLEDPKTGDLFAAAPYTSEAVVEQALDSSRFFAVRVVGEGGMKATLGIGFEERPEAFDFGVCLQDVKKVLDMGVKIGGKKGIGASGKAPIPVLGASDIKRDYSLKEGETIKINIGGKMTRGRKSEGGQGEEGGKSSMPFAIPPPPGGKSSSNFSIPPPPYSASGGDGGGSLPFLPPTPGAADIKAGRRRHPSSSLNELPQKHQPSAADLGFDDGEFGEFQ
ncbi:DUF1681-domain-containing protein [Tothia fuscella]|uniref:DUF1681-domain-containing protein n=1 Tax=Tothia fuscella TaxID=1048955 RepID=A0A9P4NWR4_9PEZI|nr:DUF1681-domain-containing protein [Tothia fuscella]